MRMTQLPDMEDGMTVKFSKTLLAKFLSDASPFYPGSQRVTSIKNAPLTKMDLIEVTELEI